MKDLNAVPNPLATTVSHNKRQSQDRTLGNGKQTSSTQSNLNALDTYNKLLQLMNDKVLKNVNNVLNTGASRGKSGEKSGLQQTQMQNAQINQGRMSTSNAGPHPLNQSSSQKKIKTVGGGVGQHSGYTFSSGSAAGVNAGVQSRDKSIGGGVQGANGSNHQSISTVLKSQAKIVSNNGSSRNTNAGIQGQMNTQNATKQFLSFYSNPNYQQQQNNQSKKIEVPHQNSSSINLV